MSLRIGLALGGGAALGLAHIGVLKVLSEEGIGVDCVAGTSAGSVVGAAYCAGRSWRQIWDAARRLEWSHLVSLTIPRQGMMRLDRLERYIEATTGVQDFAGLRIPFAAVATDLERGEPVVFTSGSVAKAVRASCSVPGLFEPLRLGEVALVDGGLVNDVPADVARGLGADIVIAVNLHSRRLQSGPPRNILDIAYYTFDILLTNSAQKGMSSADIVVSPDLQGFHYRNLKRADELVIRGEQAMRAGVQELRRLIAVSHQRRSNA
ncbi:MAG TPA: patatin-like phospholipase family protein [Spirochaetia bacterium]|nr:patatin-like phospholipase family protein [Spirochaetia bacterium]